MASGLQHGRLQIPQLAVAGGHRHGAFADRAADVVLVADEPRGHDGRQRLDVSSATCEAASCRFRVMGPSPALNAELENASRNSPPSASRPMRPALAFMPGQESINAMTSSMPRILIVDCTAVSSFQARGQAHIDTPPSARCMTVCRQAHDLDFRPRTRFSGTCYIADSSGNSGLTLPPRPSRTAHRTPTDQGDIECAPAFNFVR